ncbi:MAG: mechanosensitive ion channel [Leptospira sp.]|nr:mechanosensitive ion channel [Leptospira sp.]
MPISEIIDLIDWVYLSKLGYLFVSLIMGAYILPLFITYPMKWMGMKIKYYWDNYRGPIRFFLSVMVMNAFKTYLDFGESKTEAFLNHFKQILVIIGITWFWIRSVSVGRDYLLSKYDITKEDNLQARKVVTQIRVMRQILNVLILIISFSAILMSFESIRQFGLSLLASAGVAGIIMGFAAQKSIANIFAGLQIAITQPIRLDDVVIFEGEWGRIEEITLTYVVVKIWDERRLIVPISQFIERPFQNWTRVSADILGTIFFYLDYSVPLDVLRKELTRIVENHPNWDKRVCGIQVTNCTNTTMEVRALISAKDASKAWDLRCDIREQLLVFLQKKYPHSLPTFRVDVGKKAS